MFSLQVLKDFFHSEKGVFGYALPLIIATVFAFLDRITEQQWMDFAFLMATIYIGGKTIQGSAAVVAGGQKAKAEAEAAKAEVAVLKSAASSNDAAADAALEKKFSKTEG